MFASRASTSVMADLLDWMRMRRTRAVDRRLLVRFARVVLIAAMSALSACSEESSEVAATPQDMAVLVERSFLGNRLKVAVPPDFQVMDDEMLRLKYPTERRPTLVLTNPAGSINIAINHTQNGMAESKVASTHSAIDRMFKNLHPSATWFRSEVTRINGRAAFVLDLRTPAIDTEVRNIMVATHLDDRMLLLSFNCTRELEAQWEPIGQKIASSMTVTE